MRKLSNHPKHRVILALVSLMSFVALLSYSWGRPRPTTLSRPDHPTKARVSEAVNPLPLSFTGNQVPTTFCKTICFRSPQYWLLNLNRLPSGTVIIGGVNNNAPVSTSNIAAIQMALGGLFGLLQGGTVESSSSSVQQLNRGFVAAQLGLLFAGGQTIAFEALWSHLSCYDLFFAPISLSNGVILTPNSVLNDLFEQALLAIQENREGDVRLLASLFDQLNGSDPFGLCNQRPPDFNGPPIINTSLENPTKPACGCSSEPTYNQGISLVTQGVTKCQAVGMYPGINQDTGGGAVFLHNGEFIHHALDLEITGRGFNWKFERKYRSGITFDGPLGHNWEFNYNRRLFIEANGNVLRMDGSLRVDRYILMGSTYQAPLGFYTELKRNPNNPNESFIERDKRGTKVVYRAPNVQGLALMTRLQDRNGNEMRFEYNAQDQLVRVIETLGRSILYRYNTEGRLIEVEDFNGRKIQFGYDLNGDLVTVTSPAVFGTPNGNDFPVGKTTRYRYSSGFNDQRLNHNLVEITAPNEVAANGPPRIKVEYDTDLTSSNIDRVLRQTIGGVNASGVPAGGKITYAYLDLGVKPMPGTPPLDINASVSETDVIDRNGNITKYQFNELGNIVLVQEFANRSIRGSDPAFFETRYGYNKEGEMTRMIKPEGNTVEYVYDSLNPDRFQQGNILGETRLPDPKRGGDQAFIRISRTYEPMFNQVRTETEARGNDSTYVPQNGGANSPGRYTTVYFFDYQEGTNFAALADKLGTTEAEVRQRLAQAQIPMGLGDINRDGLTDQVAGNVVKVNHPAVNLLPGSNMASIEGSPTQPIEDLYTYNRFGQVTSLRDPEGNVTLRTYYPENDPDGDGLNLTPGVSSGPFGYLKQETRDAVSAAGRDSNTNPTPTAIRRQYFYDPVGNVIREIDGRGIETRYFVNQLNQVVQIIRAADVSQALANPEEPNWKGCSDATLVECNRGMVVFRYLTNIFYDHNNNVIRREIENRDSNNQSLVGNFVTYSYLHDILDKPVEEQQEASENPPQILVKRFRYDHNENRVLEISPVAVAGAQPSNVVSYVRDERDLLFTSTRGGLTGQFKHLTANTNIPEITQIPNSPDLSTFTRIYDLNRNLTRRIDGADKNGDGRPEETTHLYDGFDREVGVIDGVGNRSVTNYDPASNIVRVSKFGPLGRPSPIIPPSGGQPLLSQFENKYDELSRLFERDDRLFAYNGVTYVRPPILQDGPLGGTNDGVVTTRFEYDRNGRRTFSIEDDLGTIRTLYDGANRATRKIDPEENELLYTYDDDNNLTKIVEVEITRRDDVRAGKVPDLRETFTTINVYDALNRLIRKSDNLGQTSRKQYDSRNNLIFTSDAQHSKESTDLITDPLGLFPSPGQDSRGVTKINRDGNTMEYLFDGINRKLAKIHHLRVDGQGKNPIDTSNQANPDGLIVINYTWDANSRLVAMADDKGNPTRYLYDELNRRKREIFADNTANDYTYDADNNLVRMVDENGSIIRNTFDGVSRLVHKDITRANQVIGTTRQEFEYDGLSRLTRSFDNNEPNDPRDDATVTYAYDSLSRLLEEVQNGLAVSSRWTGDDNRIGLVYPNGREIKLTYDKDDRIDRITDAGGGTAQPPPIVDYDYIGPDRVLERTYGNGVRLTHLDDQRQQDVGYDGRRRVRLHRHLGQDNSLVAGFVYDYDRANNKQFEVKQHEENLKEDYSYDSIYRLGRFAIQGAPEEAIDTWQFDGVGNWAKRKDVPNQVNVMNEYTIFAGVSQVHDNNGNLIDDGMNRYEYDFANRLCKVTSKGTVPRTAIYRYDAQGRRFEKVVTFATFGDRVRFLYDGWREIEERRDSSTQQYVYGRWIDEPLTLDLDSDNDGKIEQRFFYHDDAKRYITALTDSTGMIIERYTYDAYGKPMITDAVGNSLFQSAVGNPYLFSGRRFDPETGFYYYRMRYLNAVQGRFIQRDPLRYADGVNLYEYVRSNPVMGLDPMGLPEKPETSTESEDCGDEDKDCVSTDEEGNVHIIFGNEYITGSPVGNTTDSGTTGGSSSSSSTGSSGSGESNKKYVQCLSGCQDQLKSDKTLCINNYFRCDKRTSGLGFGASLFSGLSSPGGVFAPVLRLIVGSGQCNEDWIIGCQQEADDRAKRCYDTCDQLFKPE